MSEKKCGWCGSVPTEDNDIEEWWFGDIDQSGTKKWQCLTCQLSEIPDIQVNSNGKWRTVPFRNQPISEISLAEDLWRHGS